MPLSAGVYTRLYNWLADRNNSINIMAERMDAEFDAVGTAISTAIMKDGQTTITGNIPFNNKLITGLGDATADTHALNRQTADARYVVGTTANISAYGGAPDGATGTKAAVVAAVADGAKTIVFDEGASSYYWEAAYSLPSGVRLVAGSGTPTFTFNAGAGTSRFFVMSGVTRAGLYGIKFNGTAISAIADSFVVISSGAIECKVENCIFDTCPGGGVGSVVISGATSVRNRIAWNRFIDTQNTAIGIIAGQYNTVTFNDLTDTLSGFGIRIGELASYNTVSHNRSVTSALESIGVYYNCDGNRIIGNHCEASGDNGISISGRYSVVEGNVCLSNEAAGIGVWGEFNTITGNVLKNNGQVNDCPLWTTSTAVVIGDEVISSGYRYRCTTGGTTSVAPSHSSGTVTGADGVAWLHLSTVTRWSGVWISVGFSGTGQFNAVSSNLTDDDQTIPTQYHAVRIEGSGGYTAWANGQTITSGLYRVNGLNIYISTNSGTTATGSEPVHTSGTATGADGVTWEWRKAFISTAAPRGNEVTGNIGRRTKSNTGTSDAAGWAANTLRENGASFQNAVNGYRIINVPSYASNALALAGGLVAGDFYRNGDALQIVH